MFDSGTLAGKKILVTGGGSGLGLAMSDMFASLGADVAICGRMQLPTRAGCRGEIAKTRHEGRGVHS